MLSPGESENAAGAQWERLSEVRKDLANKNHLNRDLEGKQHLVTEEVLNEILGPR